MPPSFGLAPNDADAGELLQFEAVAGIQKAVLLPGARKDMNFHGLKTVRRARWKSSSVLGAVTRSVMLSHFWPRAAVNVRHKTGCVSVGGFS